VLAVERVAGGDDEGRPLLDSHVWRRMGHSASRESPLTLHK
jgi:hypothetical protein